MVPDPVILTPLSHPKGTIIITSLLASYYLATPMYSYA